MWARGYVDTNVVACMNRAHRERRTEKSHEVRKASQGPEQWGVRHTISKAKELRDDAKWKAKLATQHEAWWWSVHQRERGRLVVGCNS